MSSRLIAFVVSVVNAFATTLRVPSEYSTIEAAFDSLISGDTVLVDVGIYAEALVSPPYSFVLKGNAIPDTGNYPRPVVNPSSLTNPTTRTCLTINSAAIIVEDFVFRNGSQMYPHVPATPGGVHNNGDNTIFRRCLFDSTHYGLKTTVPISLENCEFINNSYRCIYGNYSRITATDCYFENRNGNWATVDGGSGSMFTRCFFWQDSTNIELLILTGSNITVRQCTFRALPRHGLTYVVAAINSGLFEENDFSDFTEALVIVGFSIPRDSSLIIRNNNFADNFGPENPVAGGKSLSVVANSGGTEMAIQIIGNTFRDCTANVGPTAISLSCNARVDSNRIARMTTGAGANIRVDGNTIWRSNLLYDNQPYVMGETDETIIDARWNWWGDSTGPFHWNLNPNGEGDWVSNGVLFEPWLLDTLPASSTPERPNPLPEIATLEVYPNPFNLEATLKLIVPKAVIVRIEIFDILGRSIDEIFSGPVSIEKEIKFNASKLSSGLYFARAYDTIGNRPVAMAKLLLLK